MLIGIIIAILVILILVYFYSTKKTLCEYNSKDGKIVLNGTDKNYIIRKDNRFEFLVKNGDIVAYKDKTVSDKFKYY